MPLFVGITRPGGDVCGCLCCQTLVGSSSRHLQARCVEAAFRGPSLCLQTRKSAGGFSEVTLEVAAP